MTLLPGDVILTGTPAGVGPLRPGDEVSVTIEGIGNVDEHGGRQRVDGRIAMTVRVRFAPSPTGDIHVGNIRTALVQLGIRATRGWHFRLPR